MLRIFLTKGLLVLLILWSSRGFGFPLTVFFLTGADSRMPVEVLSVIKKEIEGRSGTAVSAERFDGVFRAGEMVVAFGVGGAKEAASLDPRIPVLSLFVPESAFGEISKTRMTGQFSAIYIDQPVKRQMNLVRIAFPQKARIGVLLGPSSSAQLPLLEKSAKAAGLELSQGKAESPKELFSSLDALLKECETLLAVPDPAVFNSGSISEILLSAYRRGVPLVGFSASYVKAGALLALYSTVEQIGWQAADAVSEFSRKGVLPQPQYPVYFTVGVNRYVARSMGIEIQSEATFEERLGQMEEAP